jgi:stress-induced morphogen
VSAEHVATVKDANSLYIGVCSCGWNGKPTIDRSRAVNDAFVHQREARKDRP